MTQYALMCGKLSSISRLIAMTFRSITPEGLGRWAICELSGWNASGMNVWNPPVSSCSSRSRTRWSIRCFGLVDVAVEHRGVRVQPEPVRRAVDVEPGLGRGLGPADLLADLGMEDLGPAAGQAPEPGVDEVPEHLLDRLPRDLARRTRSRRPCTP